MHQVSSISNEWDSRRTYEVALSPSLLDSVITKSKTSSQKNKDSRPISPIPYLLNVLDATSSNQDRVPGFALHEAVVWHPAERNLRHCQIVLLRNILNKLECLEIGLVPVPSGSSQMNVKESCDRTETIQGLTERDNSAENMER